jgi:serine phosphatase RsbU (regulator of sigma subunit)/tetratricopeptide (TPR) repeat protein
MKGVRQLTIITTIVLFISTLCSCNKAQREELKASHADSLIFAAGALMQYDRLLTLVDSFEATGDINKLDAYRWRGVYYYRQNQYRMSEVCFRKALDHEVKTDFDQLVYNKVVRRLSELLVVRGDYEGALQIAVPAIDKMDKTGIGSDVDYAILYNNIGVCQLNLGQDKEAAESFEKARENYRERWETDTTSRGLQEGVVGTVYTSQAYIKRRNYEQAIYWTNRTEMLLDEYRQRPDARTSYFDEYQGRIEIMRATALQGLGQKKLANEAYKRFLQTAFSKTGTGRIHGNDYLVSARRYREAADNYRYLDKAMAEHGLQPTLDVIQQYMLPKCRANYEAHRADSANAMGRRILHILDSAITLQKQSASAELATIYHTNEKENELTRQQAAMSRQQFIAVTGIMLLLLIFLVVYIIIRRKAQRRLTAAHDKLEEAHSKLKTAYGQLEETTKVKERFESELRIARDIQNSMVPSQFPTRPGLDIHASMTPAREVGGDLYDYLLQDDKLYFCVGDVSGKGVPAALFMAQAIRLFRSIAKQHQLPSTIATRINDELTEENEQGMFVTMFIGLIDLSTGHMHFCNAGHNPPVFADEFLKMETNAPIGLWEGLDFVGEEIDNVKSKPFFIYTDGLNEAENPAQEQFGDERLLEFLRNCQCTSAQEVVEAISTEVERHRNGAEPNDDMTLMYLKVD